MSYWTGEDIVYTRPEPWPDYPGWLRVDCGCCAGLEWGGEYPQECRDCGGGGFFALHEASRRKADYPGGPFRGTYLTRIWEGEG